MSPSIENVALSPEETEKCFREGIVSTKFKRIFTGYFTEPYKTDIFAKRAKEAGAKIAIANNLNCFFFTDMFMVMVTVPRETRLSNGWMMYPDIDNPVTLIPLSKVTAVEFESLNYSGCTRPTVIEKVESSSKKIIKGGIVGGVIAGAPGAVVGAIASSQSKPKVITKTLYNGGNYFSNDNVKAIIYLEKVNPRFKDTGARQISYIFKACIGGERKKIDPGSNWTVAMNTILCGWEHTVESYMDGTLLNNYINAFQSLFNEQVEKWVQQYEELVNRSNVIISKIDNIKTNPKDYWKKEEEKIIRESKVKQINEEITAKKSEINIEIDPIKSELSKVEDQIKTLTNELSSLTLLQGKRKKEIRNQLEPLNQKLCDLNSSIDIRQKELQNYISVKQNEINILISKNQDSLNDEDLIKKLESELTSLIKPMEELKEAIEIHSSNVGAFISDIPDYKSSSVQNNCKFKMRVDDVFEITGRGVVLTGIVEVGQINVNDSISIVHQDGSSISAEVLKISIGRTTYNTAQKGDNIGLLCGGIHDNNASKGDIVFINS